MGSDMSNFGTTDFDYRVALGLVPGYSTWNKFGYNPDIDIGTEVIAQFGGTYVPRKTASTLSLVSSAAADNSAGTGAEFIVLTGVDDSWNMVTELVPLNGLTPVTTTASFYGVNRASVYLSGSSYANVGTITITSTDDASIQATMPATQGSTQQAIFWTPAANTFLVSGLFLNALKISGGGTPRIELKGYVYSDVSDAKYEVLRLDQDLGVDNNIKLDLGVPFVIGERSCFWLEVTTNTNNTAVNARFSGVLVAN